MAPPIIAAMLCDPVQCPHRSAMDLFCDPAKRDGFSPIVRRRDEKQYDGDYRTKRVILEIYEAMHESIRSGQPCYMAECGTTIDANP